ncbi:MAG: sulfotransferase [Aquificae bacterium]|nr:sulfotransferase [Aquificota bacterium]
MGAEKAGTTFAVHYLKQHPDIFFPVIKEPQFFAKDVMPESADEKELWNLPKEKWNENVHIAYIRDPDLYAELYRDAERYKYRGDASVSYLFSKVAAREIYNFNPEAKILIILRNPVDRALSAYKMDVTIGRVNKPFEEAIREIPRYVERSLYYEQVKRYLDTFPRENVLILLFDDLKSDPQKFFEKIFDFLEVQPIKYSDFERKNESLKPRFPVLNYVLYKTGIKRLISKYTPKPVKDYFKKLYYGGTYEYEIDAETYNRLLEVFKSDIEKLSELIGRDLSGWLKKR